MKLIDKEKVVAEVEKIREHVIRLRYAVDANCIVTIRNACECLESSIDLFVNSIDTLEVKEVDLEKEVREYVIKNGTSLEEPDEFLTTLIQLDDMVMFAKHFYELGLKVNNPTTAADRGIAEEIIVNLKRIEQDYCIDLTKEMQWLRDIVKKGE